MDNAPTVERTQPVGDIDHRTMDVPFLRLQHAVATANGSSITVWDLRCSQPNVSHVDPARLHSLEHFLNVHFRARQDGVFLVSVLGCQTGLYLNAVNVSTFHAMAPLVQAALEEVVAADAVPLADEIHCGAAAMHDLVGARRIAAWLLSRRADWGQDTAEIDPAAAPDAWNEVSA